MKKAFVFPGQGAQFVGMGKDLYENSPEAKELFEKANEILGFRITDLMFNGTDEDLKPVSYTHLDVYKRQVAPGPLSGLSQDRKYQLRPTRREIRRGRTDMRICRLFRERRRLKRNPPGRSHRYPFLRCLRRSNGFPL